MKCQPVSFLLLLCLSLAEISAQVRQLGLPPINNYAKQDYGAETQNWATTEDIRGLLYFGNNAGLLEFDGNNWEHFELPNRSIVRAVATDSSGRIFVGGQDELGYFQGDAKGELQYTSLVSLIPEAYKNFEDVWKILITPEGIFWCTQTVVFHQIGDEFHAFPAQSRYDRFFRCRNRLYITDIEGGIKYWQNGNWMQLDVDNPSQGLSIMAILPHGEKDHILATSAQGMYLLRDHQLQPWAEVATDYLKENRIYCALPLKNGKYAIGTSHNGLLILDDNGSPDRSINKAMGLLNNSILSMLEDRNGNLWLGLENGISHIEIWSPFSVIDARLSVKGSAYASIIHEDKLYLATNQGIFFQNWTNPPIPLYPGKFQLVEDSKGPSWAMGKLDQTLIAGKHRGAFEIKDGQAKQISRIPGAWKFMVLNHHPNLAIGGNYTGLVLYEREDVDAPWQEKRALEGFEESSRVFEQDKEGHIWISHAYRGVYRVSLSSSGDQIETVDFYNSEDGFPSNLMINVCKIQGQILFTTEEGVYQFDAETERFIPHPQLNELFQESYPIHRMLEDEIGNVWFSAGDEFGMLIIEDNMLDKEITKLSFNRLQKNLVKGFEHIYAFDEQHIFIGIDEGFILYNPQIVQETRPQPLTFVREVVATAGSDSLIFGGTFVENNQLSLTQPRSKVPEFPADINDFRISYSAAYFEDINSIQYRYVLVGEDETWSHWTNKTEKEYTNLAPGTYTFIVKARTIYGQESDASSYQFIIKTPWYTTLLAKVVYLAFGGALLWLILFLNTRRIQESADIVIREQAETMERKEAEFKRVNERSEAEIIRLKNEKLEAEINHQNQELASYAMHLVQKGEILQKLRLGLEKVKKEISGEEKKQVEGLIKVIQNDIKFDKNWDQFEYHFDKVHNDFLYRLRENFPVLTPKDQKLCAYLRMNLSTKEIAPLMNISVRGVEISRYRLRKKMDLPHDTNLNEFMMTFQ